MKMSQFKLITSAFVSESYSTPITKYISERTGLTVIITSVEKPMVHCSFIIETEPENDDGYAHILEHLIFNGSKKYPYKGILEHLAEDVSSSSYIDYTKFTFSSPEPKRSLAVLPIYLNHLLYPVLSEEDYILDVHHIDENGEDGGLIYEEIKDAHTRPFNRIETILLRKMYPNSGYSCDYHGSETALRTSTSNSKVKEFHERFYRPENLTILLTGKIEHGDVFKKLTEFEDEIVANRKSEQVKKWKKPWQTIPSPPNYGEYRTFHSTQFSENIENDGYMLIGWRGPVLTNASSLKELMACEILLEYLSWHTEAPLYKCLTERNGSLAGIVSHNVNTNKVSLLRLELFDIPLKTLDQTQSTALEYIKGIRSRENSINMERIESLLQIQFRNMDKEWNHDTITMRYLSCLYLGTDDMFSTMMNPQWLIKELLQETPDYWLDLFRKYFTDDFVIVTSTPRRLENVEMEERERLDNQRSALGEQGLAEKADLLNKAKQFRERSQPLVTDLLQSDEDQ